MHDNMVVGEEGLAALKKFEELCCRGNSKGRELNKRLSCIKN